MARSNDMSTTMQYVKYYIACTQNSQNIASNTSNVTVTVHIYRTNSGYPTWGSGTMYCTINGNQYSQAITPSQVFDNTPHVEVFRRTLDIPHNADGTKVLSMSAYVTHDMFSSSSQSYSQTLTTIARKSNPTLSASSTEMEKSVTINTNRASSSFTHTLKYTFGSYTGTIATGVTTSYAWTIPLSFANQVPNATSGTGTITCETYNGNTLIGSSNVTFTATVPATVIPSFTSLGVTRVDETVPSSWGVYVKGKSKAILTINGAVGGYTSTIKSYSISGGGFSTTNSSFTTGFLNNAGSITFTATITDSRGRTATKTASITVIDYTQPNITDFTTFRANSSGTAINNGTYLRCSATFTYSSVSSKNTIGANIKFRRVGATTWTTGSNITSGTPITTGGGTVSVDYSYEVLLTVTDAFGSVTQTLPISTSAVMLDFKSGGRGVAIGKASETDNLFEVAWDTRVLGNLQVGTNNVYHTGRKPSASDVGALPIGGGTLTGSLYIGNGLTSNGANTSTFSRIVRTSTDDASSLKLQFGTGTNASFEIVNSAWTTSLFSVDINGNVTVNGGIKMINGNNNLTFGYDSGSRDIYLANVDNNWLRLKPSSVLTYGGYNVHTDNTNGSVNADSARVSNLNGIYKSGWYSWSGNGTGTPTSYGVVLNIVWGEANVSTSDRYQIAMGSNNVCYVRSCVNNAWNAWKVW